MLHAFFDFWFDVWAKFYQGRLKAYEQTKEINLYCLKAEFKVHCLYLNSGISRLHYDFVHIHYYFKHDNV